MTAVQEGLTSVHVSWTTPSDASGYRIDYTSGDSSSGSVFVGGAFTDMTLYNYLLAGLQNGAIYTISIRASSSIFLGRGVVVGLGKI